MKFVARRLLHSMALLAAISLLSFLFADLAPGDFFSGLRSDPRVARQTVEAMREQAGLNRPFVARYGTWLASSLRGDFGYSLAYNGPVSPLLWPRVGATLLLAGIALGITWAIAIPLGLWSAAARNSWTARLARALLAFLLAVPDLLLALIFLAVAVESGWFPVGGIVSAGFDRLTRVEQIGDIAWHLGLPVTVLVLGALPVLVRHIRAAVLEQIESPFVLNARALGIPRRRLLFRHILPAAAHPLVTLFGFSLGALLSAGLLIEVVMGWPGIGPFFLEAILARDFAIVLAVVMLSAAFLLLGNLTADLLLYRLDPRIRSPRS